MLSTTMKTIENTVNLTKRKCRLDEGSLKTIVLYPPPHFQLFGHAVVQKTIVKGDTEWVEHGCCADNYRRQDQHPYTLLGTTPFDFWSDG